MCPHGYLGEVSGLVLGVFQQEFVSMSTYIYIYTSVSMK